MSIMTITAVQQSSIITDWLDTAGVLDTGGYTNWLILLIRKLVQCPTPQTLHKSQEHSKAVVYLL